MHAMIQKWGNSQGLRFKKDILDALDLSVGDPITMIVRSGTIIIAPDKKRRKKVDLKKLLSKAPKNHPLKEVDWGAPVGKELW